MSNDGTSVFEMMKKQRALSLGEESPKEEIAPEPINEPVDPTTKYAPQFEIELTSHLIRNYDYFQKNRGKVLTEEKFCFSPFIWDIYSVAKIHMETHKEAVPEEKLREYMKEAYPNEPKVDKLISEIYSVEIKIKESLWHPVTWEEFEKWEDPVPLFKGFPFYKNHLHLHTGSGGDFKSLVMLEIIKAILSHEPLFGKYPVLVSGKVILIDEENPKDTLKKRLKRMGLDKYIKSGDLILLHRSDFKIDDNEWFDVIQEKIVEIQPVLVGYDSLTRVHKKDENRSTGGISDVMNRFRQLADLSTEYIIHHFNKQELKSARGSSDIPNACDMEFSNIRTGDNTLTFKMSKTRDDRFEPINLEIDGLDGLMTNTPIEVRYVGTESEGFEKTILKILEEHGELPHYTAAEGIPTVWHILNPEWKQSKIVIGEKRLKKILDSLVQKGLADKNPNGKVEGIKQKKTLYSYVGKLANQVT